MTTALRKKAIDMLQRAILNWPCRDAFFGMVLQNIFLYSMATTSPHPELHIKNQVPAR